MQFARECVSLGRWVLCSSPTGIQSSQTVKGCSMHCLWVCPIAQENERHVYLSS